ncbi:MAG TPA: protein kinase, partial [Methanocellaceae archaeon]
MWDTTGKVEGQYKGSCKRSVAAISLPSGAIPKIKVGNRIGGQYEVYRILGGEGKSGMGVVYICYDHEAREICALKTFQNKYLDSILVKDTFKREALAWMQLDWHPYIVRAIGVKELDYRLFIVLEYVPPDESGRNTLTQYLKAPIELSQALEWSIQCCLGMEHAASKGVTPHRDIKPDNLMIARDGTLKITDFGLARLWEGTAIEKRLAIESRHDAGFLHSMHNKSVVGTTPYAAPEQFEGQSDIRSDIYSFGVVMFQMASKGKLPFHCDSSEEYHEAHKLKPVPKLRSRLYPMISRCMQKKPADRYADFGELRHDLERLYRSLTRAEPPLSPAKLEMGAWEYNNKGLSLYNVGLVDDAIREYRKALRLKPGLAIVHNNLGIALSDKGIYEGAMREYKEALRLDPSLAIAHNNLGTALKASGA